MSLYRRLLEIPWTKNMNSDEFLRKWEQKGTCAKNQEKKVDIPGVRCRMKDEQRKRASNLPNTLV